MSVHGLFCVFIPFVAPAALNAEGGNVCPITHHSESSSFSSPPAGWAFASRVIRTELGFNTGGWGWGWGWGHRPEGSGNGGGSPCKRRSRCWACSHQACAGLVVGWTGGGQSSKRPRWGRAAELALGQRPGEVLEACW